MQKLRLTERPTNPLVWLAAILCAAVAIAVAIAGIIVIAVYLIYNPKMPFFSVPYAHLNRFDYDQSGLLQVELGLAIVAENQNARAHADFSGVGFDLRFYRVRIAQLLADPFEVAKNSSIALSYVVPSSPIPLDESSMAEVDVGLKEGRLKFELEGQARTRWKIGGFLSLSLWAHLACPLEFSYPNGTSIGLDCNSNAR